MHNSAGASPHAKHRPVYRQKAGHSPATVEIVPSWRSFELNAGQKFGRFRHHNLPTKPLPERSGEGLVFRRTALAGFPSLNFRPAPAAHLRRQADRFREVILLHPSPDRCAIDAKVLGQLSVSREGRLGCVGFNAPWHLGSFCRVHIGGDKKARKSQTEPKRVSNELSN